MKVLGETSHPAHEDSVPYLIEFVSEHAKNLGFPDQKVREIDLSLREALSNILRFSCGDGHYELRIVCSLDNAGRFVLIISDNGEPFNMLLESDPFLTPDAALASDQKPSTKIMKRLIKNIEYKRFENKNVLTFTVPAMSGS